MDFEKHSTRGLPAFTLLEVGIALALLGILLGIAVPSLNALTGAELKKTTSMVQGLIRDTYARTALTGNSHRIVFDLDTRKFWVEASEGAVVTPRNPLELGRDNVAQLDVVHEKIEDIEADTDDEQERTKLSLYAPPTWAKVDDEVGQDTPLPSGVRYVHVWSDHLEDRAKAGKVSLLFFPGGSCQEAHITLSDGDVGEENARTLTIVTQPLTGETFVEEEVPRLPVF